MIMAGRFGVRKSPDRLYGEDFSNAALLGNEVLELILGHGDSLLLNLPEDFPDPVQWPASGTNDVRGQMLMDYTLYMTGKSLDILRSATALHNFIYAIDSIPRKPGALYRARAGLLGKQPRHSVQDEYLKSMIWVLKALREALDKKKGIL